MRPGLPWPCFISTSRAVLVEDGIQEWIDKETITQALDNLAADEREILIMRAYEGMTFREIAGVTGRFLPTVTTKYYAVCSRVARDATMCGLSRPHYELRKALPILTDSACFHIIAGCITECETEVLDAGWNRRRVKGKGELQSEISQG